MRTEWERYFVDTPGIGDSIEYKTMLEEYIPKAVAFVIVIDVSRGGGLQKDRVNNFTTNTTVVCYSFSFIVSLSFKSY